MEALKFWRRTDERNPGRVQGSTFGGDMAALCSFYDWTSYRFGIPSPIDKHSVVREGVRREVADIGRTAVLAAIAAGGAASAAMAGPRLALASAAAFVLSELADLAVYQPLRRRGWVRAVIASNAVGAPIDTIGSLALAGFPIWAAVPGQLLPKATATAAPVAVVLGARALLRHRLRPNRP
jgi:hypothetical protein